MPLDPRTGLSFTRRFCQLGRAHTKVVGTLGPAAEPVLGELLEAGLSVARVNFSHGTPQDHRRRIAALRRVARERGLHVGVLADLRGPKIRLGDFPGGRLELEARTRVPVRSGAGPLPPGEVPVQVAGLERMLRPGQRIFLADGAVELVVEEARADGCLARVVRGGEIGDGKGVHLPDTPLELEVPTEEDLADLELAAELEVDFVGVSFVSRAEEVRRVRERIPGALLVAKIERAAALENLEELLEESDGVMVARGDLGVEVALEELPMVQKSLIRASLDAGRFTITATEMLESMVTSSRPTRAEVADVANAVLDGSDAVMLSAETAVGRHPVRAVETMERVARAVEASQRYLDLPREAFRASEPTFSNAVALAAVQAADALGLAKIVCFTETGNTVRLLSRYRPHAEIVALSPHARTLTQSAVLAHVRPVHFERRRTLEEMLEHATRELLERKLLAPAEQIVFVAGVPPGVAATTNVLKLHRVGDSIALS